MPLSAVQEGPDYTLRGVGVVTGGGGGLGGRACVGRKGAGSAKGRQCESMSTQEQQSSRCLGSAVTAGARGLCSQGPCAGVNTLWAPT